LPPHLGLIASRDGGRTWESVSLAGDADFHVLRVVEDLIYGYDAATAMLLVSQDGGKSWTERVSPGEVIDLAVNPGDARHLPTKTPTSPAAPTWAACIAAVGPPSLDMPTLMTVAVRFISTTVSTQICQPV
jgi:hypothetical protein